jgi:hypothetical protein
VGQYNGSQARDVLISLADWEARQGQANAEGSASSTGGQALVGVGACGELSRTDDPPRTRGAAGITTATLQPRRRNKIKPKLDEPSDLEDEPFDDELEEDEEGADDEELADDEEWEYEEDEEEEESDDEELEDAELDEDDEAYDDEEADEDDEEYEYDEMGEEDELDSEDGEYEEDWDNESDKDGETDESDPPQITPRGKRATKRLQS